MTQYTGHIESLTKDNHKIVIEGPRGNGVRNRIIRRVKGTQKQAKEEMRHLLNELENGTYVEPSRLTVGEYLLRWLKDYGESNLADSTLESYTRIIKKHVIPELGDKLLTGLNPLQLQEYCTHKLETLSKRTVQYHHRVVREALQHAVDWRIIAINPADRVKAPKSTRPEISVPDLAGVQRLISAKVFDHLLIVTALFTGMRRGELLGLRWSDIHWDTGVLSVVQQVQHIEGKGLVFKDSPKGRRRNITAPKFLITMLKTHKADQSGIRLMYGDKYQSHDLVFSRLDGAPEYPSNLSHRFKNVVDKIQLHGMRLHDTRHYHATLLLGLNIAAGKVQERLGHQSIQLTIDTYSHVSPNMQQEIADMLDTLWQNLPGHQSGTN